MYCVQGPTACLARSRESSSHLTRTDCCTHLRRVATLQQHLFGRRADDHRSLEQTATEKSGHCRHGTLLHRQKLMPTQRTSLTQTAGHIYDHAHSWRRGRIARSYDVKITRAGVQKWEQASPPPRAASGRPFDHHPPRPSRGSGPSMCGSLKMSS